MFGETTIFYIKIWNHPIETTIYKWLFGVPGRGFDEFWFQMPYVFFWAFQCWYSQAATPNCSGLISPEF